MAWIVEDRRQQQVKAGEPLLTEDMKAHLRDTYFARYPTKRAVTLPALHLVQHTYGWIPTQAIQEVAEECLVETADGWLGGRFGDTWLPTPYQGTLRYREASHFSLTPLSGAARPVQAGALRLLERPQAYVHLPTASLQLVYDLRMELPRDVRDVSLFHVDERLESGPLVARLDRRRPDLYLLPLEHGQPTDALFTLRKGELVKAATRGIWLSESFAEQDGWLVRDERIRFRDWLDSLPPANGNSGKGRRTA